MQLEFVPKQSSMVSKASSFLSKVQTIKKTFGMESDIKKEDYDKITQDKAKRSITHLVNKMMNEMDED